MIWWLVISGMLCEPAGPCDDIEGRLPYPTRVECEAGRVKWRMETDGRFRGEANCEEAPAAPELLDG